MKYKILTTIMIFMVCISFISAEFKAHKQNQDLEFSFSDTLAGNCNITTLDKPDGSVVFINQEMTKNGDTFNATIYSGNFTLIGDHCLNIECTDGYGSVCRTVTPSGFLGTLGFYFLILILSIGMILFGFYIKDAYVVILGGFSLIFVGLFVLFYGIDGIKDVTYTWAIGIITLMLGAYLSIKGSFEVLDL